MMRAIDELEAMPGGGAETQGLDLERFREDIAAPDILNALARDHQEAVGAHGVFGTPTIVFPDGGSAYVRLAEAPEGADAIRVTLRDATLVALEPSSVVAHSNVPLADWYIDVGKS